jgi:hypothetical protein
MKLIDREGIKEAYSVDIVVACGAINSALLLLRSACDKHPDGLANSSVGPRRGAKAGARCGRCLKRSFASWLSASR